MTKRFDSFFETIAGNEGDFSNDPLDKGGRTIRGISENNHPADFNTAYYLWSTNKPSLFYTFIKNFYYRNYYNPLYDKIGDESLAYKLFDFGINAGISTAVKRLQKVINDHYAGGDKDVIISDGEHDWHRVISHISVDGAFGNKTLEAVNMAWNYDINCSRFSEINGETKLYNYYVLYLDTYYKSLSSFWKFGKGWLRRLRMLFNNGKLTEGKY